MEEQAVRCFATDDSVITKRQNTDRNLTCRIYFGYSEKGKKNAQPTMHFPPSGKERCTHKIA